MINSLSLIDEVNKITQVKILFSAFSYLIQDCKEIIAKKKIPSEFHHLFDINITSSNKQSINESEFIETEKPCRKDDSN